MALNPVRTPPISSGQPTVPPQDDAMDLDEKVEGASKRTLEQMREGSPESQDERLSKWARLQAAEELFVEWTSPKTNVLMEIEPELQGTPNPFTFIKIRLKVPEGQIPPTFEIQRFALTALSPAFETLIESDSASMSLALPDPFPPIHPQAARFLLQFAQQKVKLIPAHTLEELKAKFSSDEFDAILRDIVRLCALYKIDDLWTMCVHFMKEELKTNIEHKFPHYFHWAALTTPGPLLKFFEEAFLELSKEPQWRAKIWPLLPALYEGNYQECSAEQKGECQEFLHECFEKIVETQFNIDRDEELNDFCQCFVGLFPRFDFRRSLLNKMNKLNPFLVDFPTINPRKWPNVFYVFMWVKGNFQQRNVRLPRDIPAEGKLREYHLLIQAIRTIPQLNEFIAQYPENIFAFCLRANLHMKASNYADAHKDADRVLQLKPDFRDALSVKGNCYYSVGDYDATIKTYEKILKQRNDFIPALIKLGICYLDQGLFVDAMRSSNRALELDPQSIDALLNRARCYLWQGDLDAAWENAEQMLRLEKDQINARRTQAGCHRIRGKFKEAIEIYNQVFARAPKDQYTLTGRAECHLRLGNLDEALGDLNLCFEMMLPNYAKATVLRGLCHLKRGDIASARRDLARALEEAAKLIAKISQNEALSLCAELQEQLNQISG